MHFIVFKIYSSNEFIKKIKIYYQKYHLVSAAILVSSSPICLLMFYKSSISNDSSYSDSSPALPTRSFFGTFVRPGSTFAEDFFDFEWSFDLDFFCCAFTVRLYDSSINLFL